MSIFFRPDQAFGKGPWTLNMSICLALRKLCVSILAKEVQVKWPNDLIVNDRKIAGILIENHQSPMGEQCHWHWSKCQSRSFPDGFHAASLAEILGHPLELDHLRKTLFIEIDAHLHRFIQENFGPTR